MRLKGLYTLSTNYKKIRPNRNLEAYLPLYLYILFIKDSLWSYQRHFELSCTLNKIFGAEKLDLYLLIKVALMLLQYIYV
jgi:hypothetical protein